MRAKKSLGQNFLKSEKALNQIVESAHLSKDDTVLEIGPGLGALTERLLDKAGRVIAVEKDDELYAQLKTDLPHHNLELVHDDILNLEPPKTPYKLVANIPYNITGAILKKFLSTERQPSQMVLLVQKEVGERIIARDGKESILSISVKAYGRPKVVDKVLAGSFSPAPKVDSCIVSIESISKEFFKDVSEEKFFEVLRAGFASKRKKLSSNLSSVAPKDRVLKAFVDLQLDPNTRAEDTSLENWHDLALKLS